MLRKKAEDFTFRDNLKMGKVSAVGCNISRIDEVPIGLAQSIHALYLGNNNIKTLEGMRQFVLLKKLSLAFNNVDSLHELQNLPLTLECLTLEGNQVCRKLNYRAKALTRLPLLKTLDGVTVTPDDRMEANLALKKEAEFFRMLEEAELTLLTCLNAQHKLQLHAQLRSKQRNRLVVPCPSQLALGPLLSAAKDAAQLEPGFMDVGSAEAITERCESLALKGYRGTI